MNNLLNDDNEGYSWEGDYEKTWLVVMHLLSNSSHHSSGSHQHVFK